MHPMTEKKDQLKKLANHIRSLKASRKGGKRADILWDICAHVSQNKRLFRHEHIAYCLVRGRSYEQIENPAEDHKPNWKIIEPLRDALQKKVDEANEEWTNQHPPKEVSNG